MTYVLWNGSSSYHSTATQAIRLQQQFPDFIMPRHRHKWLWGMFMGLAHHAGKSTLQALSAGPLQGVGPTCHPILLLQLDHSIRVCLTQLPEQADAQPSSLCTRV